MGLTPVAPGQIAAVVTTLVLRDRPRPAPLPPSPLRLVRWADPSPAAYRILFERVGAPWLWFSRLALDDAALLAQIHKPGTQVHAVTDRRGIEVGLLEFTLIDGARASLDYFGLVPEWTGKRQGDWLMAMAMALMWRPGIAEVRVNTCTLDHPAALGFYRRHGFQPLRRTIETFADPRLAGLLPRDAAPQIPLLDPASRQ